MLSIDGHRVVGRGASEILAPLGLLVIRIRAGVDQDGASAEMQQQARISAYEATRDPLTGVANRRVLHSEMAAAVDAPPAATAFGGELRNEPLGSREQRVRARAESQVYP